ncbi:MAG: AAA family ATPase [Prevotellaceae bacterium]|jgi:AAA15 family ATPase/GTPase|nr:AAA family ATPase [Prevotellaceae bacterium]
MEHFIKHIKVSNFKSIRDLKLQNCKRINLFIGYPNVGKSNLLEALSLFSLPYLNEGDNLNKFIRVEHRNELFYNVKNKTFKIETNLEKVNINININPLIFFLCETKNQIETYFFSEKLDFHPSLKIAGDDENKSQNSNILPNTNIKRYIFQSKNDWKSTGNELLLPPFGENIIDTLSYNENVADVKLWMKKEFSKFGLEYVLDKSSNRLKIQRRLNGDEVFQLPYSSIADTLQRVIFYKTAIASNSNSVLLFEEPEAHAFPPYIKTITQDIIDSKNNQFFIATHSPVVLNDFIEYADIRKQVSIFLFDFKDGQTTAKRLSDEEVDDIYNYGEDLFFNIEKFL